MLSRKCWMMYSLSSTTLRKIEAALLGERLGLDDPRAQQLHTAVITKITAPRMPVGANWRARRHSLSCANVCSSSSARVASGREQERALASQ